MKRLIVSIFVLLICTTVDAQIRTNKRGEMLGKPAFSIQNKTKNDFISRNSSNYLQIEDCFSGELFTIQENKQDRNMLNSLVYKTGKTLANNITIRLKVLKYESGLCLDKNGALKMFSSLNQDPNAPEKNVSNMYIETCKDGEFVHFYIAKSKSHLDGNNKKDYNILTDIKYMTLKETSDGSRIVFKDQPDGDKSKWKLYRIQ